MKFSILIFALLTTQIVAAEEFTSISGRPAKSYYLEIIPGESKTLLFETVSDRFLCDDRLDVKTFESSKTYPSLETGKPVSVMVFNIHVGKILAGCKKKGDRIKVTAGYTTPKSKTMSHLYITVDEDIEVKF